MRKRISLSLSLVVSLAFSQLVCHSGSERLVARADDSPSARIVTMPDMTLTFGSSGYNAPRVAQYSSNNLWFAVASATSLTLFDAKTFSRLWTFGGDLGQGAAFSPDGSVIAVMLRNGSVALLQTADGLEIRTLSGSDTARFASFIAFDPTGNRVAAASDEGMIRVWAVDDGSLLRSLQVQQAPITAGRFSQDGATLVTTEGSALATTNRQTNVKVRFWCMSSGILEKTVEGPDGPVAFALSDDLSSVYLLGLGGIAQEWTITDQGLIVRKTLSNSSITRLTAIGESDELFALPLNAMNAIRVINKRDGTPLVDLVYQKMLISAIAISPDSARLVSASVDGTVAVWHLKED